MSMVIWEASPEAAASHSIVPPHGLTPPPPPGLVRKVRDGQKSGWPGKVLACQSSMGNRGVTP